MTEQAVIPLSPTPPVAPEATPPPDKLVPLVTREIDQEIRRLAQQKEPDIEQVYQELSGTILPIVKDLATELLQLRNYVAYAHTEHAEHLDEHEERLAVVEMAALGGDSQLTSEDAELFGKVAELAEQFIINTRTTTHDPAGIQKLDEYAALVAEAKARISEIEMEDDDDDDDEPHADESNAPS